MRKFFATAAAIAVSLGATMASASTPAIDFTEDSALSAAADVETAYGFIIPTAEAPVETAYGFIIPTVEAPVETAYGFIIPTVEAA